MTTLASEIFLAKRQDRRYILQFDEQSEPEWTEIHFRCCVSEAGCEGDRPYDDPGHEYYWDDSRSFFVSIDHGSRHIIVSACWREYLISLQYPEIGWFDEQGADCDRPFPGGEEFEVFGRKLGSLLCWDKLIETTRDARIN